jgi:hypothetical protein
LSSYYFLEIFHFLGYECPNHLAETSNNIIDL